MEYTPAPVIYKGTDGKLWVEARIIVPDYIKGRAKDTARQGIDGKYYRQVKPAYGRRYINRLYQFMDDPSKHVQVKSALRGPMPLLGSAFFKDQ